MITPLLVLLIVPTWRILQRAGFNGAWALLMLVPVVGLLVPWVVSFLKWPSDRDYKTSTSRGGVIAGFVLLPLAVGVLALVAGTIEPTLRIDTSISQPMGRAPAGDAGMKAPQGFDPSTARPIN
ncbi:hypothetical protein [Acidovorax temperans]|uniref:hypothetical protein n=1 Tax=Acidovorax temperans TaxID=80878 RepID=UPI000695E8E3|nr:hypothetical protein [Acidovorax temperans]